MHYGSTEVSLDQAKGELAVISQDLVDLRGHVRKVGNSPWRFFGKERIRNVLFIPCVSACGPNNFVVPRPQRLSHFGGHHPDLRGKERRGVSTAAGA
jgi:hypothetical protein